MSAMKAVIDDIYEAASKLEDAGAEWEQAKAQAVAKLSDGELSASFTADSFLSELLNDMHKDYN